MSMKKVSVMVPTYNEEENVVPLAEGIVKQFEEIGTYDYELLFIDNDSKDSTRQKLRELCASNHKIKAIFNAKNYGQFSSPFYGLLQTTGDCVISMCADFQDPIEMIPKYLAEWENGYKIVLGQKTSSKESKIAYFLRKFYYNFMEKHSSCQYIPQVTGSGLYDREFIEVLRKVDDARPVLRGLVAELGYNIKLIPYEQPKRRAGKSSNNLARYYDAAVQNFTAYTKTGIRMIISFGVLFSLISIITTIGCVVYKCFNWNNFDLLGIALQLGIFMSTSFTMLAVGIVGEYVLNINSYMRKRPLVIEAERINFDE